MEHNNIKLLLERAKILMEQPRYDLAEGKLKEVLALQPNHSEALGMLAYATNRLKKYKIAKSFAESTLQIDPFNLNAHYTICEIATQTDKYETFLK